MEARRANAWVVGGLAVSSAAVIVAFVHIDDLMACALADFCRRTVRTEIGLWAAAVMAVGGVLGVAAGVVARCRTRRRAEAPPS